MNIDKSVTVRGSFQVEGDLLLEGRLEGSVFVTGRLDIGSEGTLVGEATCCGGTLRGKLSGILRSDEPVEIDPRAVVSGRVVAPALDFGGSAQSYQPTAVDRPKPAPEPVADHREPAPEPPPRREQPPERPVFSPSPQRTAPPASEPRRSTSRVPTVTGDQSQVMVTPGSVLGGRS